MERHALHPDLPTKTVRGPFPISTSSLTLAQKFSKSFPSNTLAVVPGKTAGPSFLFPPNSWYYLKKLRKIPTMNKLRHFISYKKIIVPKYGNLCNCIVYSSSQGFIQRIIHTRPGHRFQCVHHVVDPCIVHGTALSGLHCFKPKVYLQVVSMGPPNPEEGIQGVVFQKPIRKNLGATPTSEKTPKSTPLKWEKFGPKLHPPWPKASPRALAIVRSANPPKA